MPTLRTCLQIGPGTPVMVEGFRHVYSNGHLTDRGVSSVLDALPPKSDVMLDYEPDGHNRQLYSVAAARAWMEPRAAIAKRFADAGHTVSIFGWMPGYAGRGLIPYRAAIDFAAKGLLEHCDEACVPTYFASGEWTEAGKPTGDAMARFTRDITLALAYGRGRNVYAVFSAYTNGADEDQIEVPESANSLLAAFCVALGIDGVFWAGRDNSHVRNQIAVAGGWYGKAA